MRRPTSTSNHDIPVPPSLAAAMGTGWATPDSAGEPMEVSRWTPARRGALAEALPGRVVVVPSGTPPMRCGDQAYPFRPGSDHVWLTGAQEMGTVLVMDTDDPDAATVYRLPGGDRMTEAFWRDRAAGELWVGPRDPQAAASARWGLRTADLALLQGDLRGDALVLRGLDADVDALVTPRVEDAELAEVLARLRLVKDAYEIAELGGAVAITAHGFDDVLAEWPTARERGERWIEGTFWRRARLEGNDVGYSSIVASGSHATTLHWTRNDGALPPDGLALLDMGAESLGLYTADITRTVPISGRFTPLQAAVYDVVFRAQEAGIAAVVEGAPFRAFHEAASAVLAEGLVSLGVLTGPVAAVLDPESQSYRRYTLHGTGHMLGLDVHDCGAAGAKDYPGGSLAVGNVLTVEPGLYFQTDDLTVAPELRGLGIRIEDDILVTADGPVNLSAGLPRTVEGIEAWMASA